MKFKANTRRKAIEYEKDLVQQWKKNKTFEKSVEQRPADNAFVFYDGPPFITGAPHHGHMLISTVKDAVARFQTMKGKRVERRWGWDCHGLPAEVFVENKLGITSKKEIGTKISIADYVKECRAAMIKTGSEWEDTIERLGRWVEFEGAYKTMDADYMESVWWAFQELYEKGKIYEGEKILIYCTKDATPISKSEVAMENSYQMDTDPSVYVKFQLPDMDPEDLLEGSPYEGMSEEDYAKELTRLKKRPKTYLLAWTTTPWTLPANTAVAVNKDLTYVKVEYEDEWLILAKDTLERVFSDEKHHLLKYKIIEEMSGETLRDLSYKPLFENRGEGAHHTWHADYVTATDGTGIVHLAPAYGEEDFLFAKEHNIPIMQIVDENGHYTEGRWQGEYIWDINKDIAKTLVSEGKALKVEYIQHEYPHCHRCGSKLMYRAHPSWFMDIQGQKTDMLAANETTSWTPDVLRTGRFKNIIEAAPDWNLSRDRYWATPIPVWKGARNDGTEVVKAFGSYVEFEQFTGKKLDDYHLPNVMDIEFELDGVMLRHVGKVLDCWFESGSMPFAQFHYPFENKQKFETNFPADFVIEAIDQTRGWFYSLTAVNVGLFGKSPFENLICTGFINASDGKKLSKKLKNYTDPMILMDQFSVDSFRFLMLSSPLLNGEDFSLSDKAVGDVARKLSMIWNMYDFFTMYASVDGWEWSGKLEDPSLTSENILDQWIVSRVHQLIHEVEKHIGAYDIPNAVKPILPFIDDASNWYVRRSRRRFWKSGDDKDKQNAYQTLHYVLVMLAQVMAPFTPFLAEELYQKLTGGESVHLLDWPKAGRVNETIILKMFILRSLINQGLKERALCGVKVRQPLRFANVTLIQELDEELQDIFREELNIKTVQFHTPENTLKSPAIGVLDIDFELTPELKREGLMREVIRAVQNARKKAGLNVDDRIRLSLKAEAELAKAIDEHKQTILDETLAKGLTQENYSYNETVTIEQNELTFSLEKADS